MLAFTRLFQTSSDQSLSYPSRPHQRILHEHADARQENNTYVALVSYYTCNRIDPHRSSETTYIACRFGSTGIYSYRVIHSPPNKSSSDPSSIVSNRGAYAFGLLKWGQSFAKIRLGAGHGGGGRNKVTPSSLVPVVVSWIRCRDIRRASSRTRGYKVLPAALNCRLSSSSQCWRMILTMC